MAQDGTTTDTDAKAGMYLTFQLAEETYGLEILKVREIIGTMDITSVPRTAPYVKGVINLRGRVIPVVDLRRKFGMDEIDWTTETCIIVVRVRGMDMGLLVDRVREVLDIASDAIEAAPEMGDAADAGFLLGLGKTDDGVTILLDIGRVMADAKLSAEGFENVVAAAQDVQDAPTVETQN